MENIVTRMVMLLEPLLWLGCGIAAIIKFRGRLAATLAGIGFGLIFIRGIMWSLIPVYSMHWGLSMLPISFISLPGYAGIILICVAIICLQFQAGSSQTPPPLIISPDSTPRALEKPRYQPAWGLATAWLVLSPLSWLLGIVVFGLIIDAGSYISSREWEIIILFGIVDILVAIPAIIVFFIWLYQSWDAIPTHYQSITPGKAIGFLFIPFFNLYWIFRAIPGLSAAIRKSSESLGSVQSGNAGYAVGIAACIVSIIPYVGILSWPLFLIWLVLANQDKNRMLLEQQTISASHQKLPDEIKG